MSEMTYSADEIADLYYYARFAAAWGGWIDRNEFAHTVAEAAKFAGVDDVDAHRILCDVRDYISESGIEMDVDVDVEDADRDADVDEVVDELFAQHFGGGMLEFIDKVIAENA